MAWQSLIEEARALVVKGDGDGAMRRLSMVLNGEFFHEEALFMLGGLFLDQGQTGLGAVLTSAAIDARRAQKNEHFPDALMNLGGCYRAEHQNELAERIWTEALKYVTDPKRRAELMVNISGLYVNEGCPQKAVEWCDRALKEDPLCYAARVNRGMAYLEMRQWRKGWDGWSFSYNAGDRHRRQYIVGDNKRPLPDWKGDPDHKVIVYGDQGIGDEIYFANSLPDLIKSTSGVILDCHPRLEHLFRRSFPGITVHGTRKHLSDLPWVRDCGADSAICLADLPGFFRNSNDEWRGEPYLKAFEHPSLDKPQRAWVRGDNNRKVRPSRIGLSWTGGTKKTRTELRSLSLMDLVPIIQSLYGPVHWFSLQYTPDAAREVCELEEHTSIRISHYPGWVETFDYDRTASFVNSLDLVITVCTTVHHLAGALGVPCWTLVPSRPSWRYCLSGDLLPWYNSVRLFRQENDGDWSAPIQRIAEELGSFGRQELAAE